MHKIILIFIGCVFILMIAACAEKPGTNTSDTSVQAEDLKAFEDLKAMFSTDTVVAADVKAKYEETMQSKVIAANPQIDEKISLTLQAAVDGALSAGQAKQAIDKGLQWYFYTQITALTKEKVKTALAAGDIETAKAALEQAIELYQGSLRSTAGKRDTYYADYGVMTQDLLDTTVIPGLAAALEKGDVLSYNLYRQMLDKTFIKIFHLAVMKYAASAPQADQAKGKVEVTEGYFFYMPIYDSLKAGSEEDADLIADAFGSGDPARLSADEINNAFAAAINGKISGYINKTIDSDMAEGDLEAAQEHTMEGNMFLSALEVLIKMQLGVEAYNTAQTAGENYFDAVKAGDIAAARKHSLDILKLISKLNGVQE